MFVMVIWHELLSAFNIVSKILQSEEMDIDAAIFQLKGLVSFLKDYRETGFERAKVEAMRIANEMEIEPEFYVKPKRSRKRKRHFDEDVQDVDEGMVLQREEGFRIDYFINIMDQAIVSVETRFEQFQRYELIFGFLFDLKKLKSASDDGLMESCVKLEAFLTHGEHSDVDGKDLFIELKLLKEALPKEIKRARGVGFLKKNGGLLCKYMDSLPYVVDNSSFSCLCREKFFKVEADKEYLRSTMSQDRLNGLAMMSIERDMIEELGYENLINDCCDES